MFSHDPAGYEMATNAGESAFKGVGGGSCARACSARVRVHEARVRSPVHPRKGRLGAGAYVRLGAAAGFF